jgi:Protein of unknown function (DUF429)
VQPEAVAGYTRNVTRYLHQIQEEFRLEIQRIAIDAPSAPRSAHLPRRLAEQALDKVGISCFTTPSEADWDHIRTKVQAHLSGGGAVARLPHANQLWMLVGFALFRALSTTWECIEVYPQATSFVLGSSAVHKSSAQGLAAQLAAASLLTGWPPGPSDPSFARIAWAPPHDRLDAYLAAWVASLPAADRRPFGQPPDDVIWVPAVAVSVSDDS